MERGEIMIMFHLKAKYLGISVGDLFKNYRHPNWGGMGVKELPAIDGIHYGHKSYITPEVDHILMGNDTYG